MWIQVQLDKALGGRDRSNFNQCPIPAALQVRNWTSHRAVGFEAGHADIKLKQQWHTRPKLRSVRRDNGLCRGSLWMYLCRGRISNPLSL
jgi:hypothetical protein